MELHNLAPYIPSNDVANNKRKLILQSAHELPSVLPAFAVLGSAPFNMYKTISFDKLHVVDFGIIRQFCVLVNTVIRRHCYLPPERIMTIVNYRYNGLPQSARLVYHRPFRTTQDESRDGISAKIRRQSAPFLWCCLMKVSDLSINRTICCNVPQN